MALSSQQVTKIWNDFIDKRGLAACSFDIPGLSSAVIAADSWCTANAASFNQALPQPFQGTATAPEKALLLALVCMSRFGLI